MRVLQLIDSLDAGGAERMAVTIANALVSSVERSYICTTRSVGLLKQSIQPSVGYLFLKKKGTFDVRAIWRFYQFIKREQITIIHAHSTSFFLGTLMKILQPKLRLVWHDHYGNSAFLAQRPKRVLSWASAYFSHIYCVNSDLEHWAKTHLRAISVSYLPNFVASHSNVPLITVLKGEQGKRILCLANLRPQKDHITLLKAFKIVHLQHPDWSLHCVGQDFNDVYSKSVYALVSDLELTDAVHFYGSCPDVGAIIQQSSLGVLSSQSEGLPVALLEYGLGKLAVVATDVGDCQQVICSEDQGVLVESKDAEALAKALLNYIEDTEKQKLNALRLQAYVSQYFSEKTIISAILKQYDLILG